MIGQETLKSQFEKFKTYADLPRCIMLLGEVGSGRRTFANWVANQHHLPLVEIGNKVDDIRKMIYLCNKAEMPTIYLIPDVESLTAAAQNSMLKVLEEPPKDAIFILTACQEDMVLSTINSRCQSYRLGCYSKEELTSYINLYHPFCIEHIDFICSICVCPGEIELLAAQDIVAFKKYVELVFQNIAKVSGPNAFKIGNKLNLADDTTKFDLVLFWKAFTNMCIEHISGDYDRYAQAVAVTMKSKSDLRIRGVNKQMAFDDWLLNIRAKWL